MDVHLEMSYCTYGGFKVLASTYLQVKEEEKLEVFHVIKDLLEKVKVTPAEIAGELMKSENVEMVLKNVIHWLRGMDILAATRWSHFAALTCTSMDILITTMKSPFPFHFSNLLFHGKC
ncbi:hypothetical protein Tco_0439292 [Tanacetum coccineum]